MTTGGIKTHTSLTKMLTESVQAHPDRIFLRAVEGDLTYRETHDRVARLAGCLSEHHLGVGESAALIMHNSLDQVLTWFALARIGATHAPINTALVGDRLRHVLATAEATTLVIDEAFASAAIQVLPALPRIRLVIVRKDIHVDPAPSWPDGLPVIEFGELATCGDPHAVVERDDLAPATLLFTSGTTGLSKACVLSDRYLARQGQIHAREFRFTPTDVLYSPFPLFHIDTATLTILAALAAGCTAAIGNRFSASRFWDEVRRFDASVFNFMGATLTLLWKRPPTADDRRHRVRMAWGVPMPDWQPGWETRFNIPLFQVYGSTDVGVPVYDPLDGSQRRGTCGRVVDEFEVVIRGEGHLTPDAPGEILVRGREPGITMNGYHGLAAETAEVIDQDGWVHTGDLGDIDADGFLSFHGRLSDSIRRRGENISAFEVEQMLLEHPDVLEAAAVGVNSELTEEDVKACVVLRPESNLSPAELHAFCLAHAPRFMVPRYIEIRASLPKTPTEKVEKFKLRNPTGSILVWDSERLGPEARRAGQSQESK
jgi:crotonobetaine/carnitine-CoA ligase